uniref:Uncharacterized protein n=1 Tax=Globodera pallida TaxID=36090 RepID=A0A183C8F4_GLOPA
MRKKSLALSSRPLRAGGRVGESTMIAGGKWRALPPGVKGSHLQTISSKNLPTVNEAHRYYYPPRMPLPLPTCFHNPTGYPCCNPSHNF